MVAVINVSRIIHSRNFEMDITIIRTHGGHWTGTEYVGTQEIIQVKGILVSPKNSKEIQPTEQGDQATGFVEVYFDANTPVYTTRDREDNHNNISDIVAENYGTPYQVNYRVTNVFNRATWGFYKAEAVRMGAI
jgi:hypothetical protein